MQVKDAIKNTDAEILCTAEELARRPIVEDFYIFDVSLGYTVVSARAKERKLAVGDCIIDLLGVEEAALLRDAALSYTEEVLLLSTALGVALIVTGIIPSSCIGIILFPNAQSQVVINLAASGVVGNYAVPEFYPRSMKLGKKDKKFFLDFCQMTGDIGDCFAHEIIEFDRDSDYYRSVLTKKLRSLALFVGCALEVDFKQKITLSKKFDYSMFIAAALLMLCLCRRESVSRRAKAEISRFKSDISIAFEFDTTAGDLINSSEAEAVKNVADCLNLVYDSRQSDTDFRFRICPIREDWSLLGLKMPNVFRWDI